MHITGIKVGSSSHPAFDENIEIKLDEKVNLFIGPNACGKTSLLRVLAYCGGLRDQSLREFFAEVEISEDWETLSAGYDLDVESSAGNGFSQSLAWSDVWHMEVPWMYVPATRIVLPSIEDLDTDELPFDPRTLPDDVSDQQLIEWHNDTQIFDGRRMEGVVSILFDSYKRDVGSNTFHRYVDAIQTAYDCAKSVSAEILTGRPENYVSGPFAYMVLEPEDIEPLALEPDVRPAMGVADIGKRRNRVERKYVGDLSAGTQGVYLWALYVATKMVHHYKFERRWAQRPAILLIDEIENHLHPTWQRRVIPALLEHFPGLQIFATTHSPFVVAGLKAGQVHLLNRDADGVVTASTNTEDIVGSTADEILRTMMGVEDPTDEGTAAAARELRQLRDEGPRDSVEAEAKRDARMQELRRLVDRDLLAGGPMAARRELFEQQFNEALEKYRQSRDLGQDSG